MASCSTCGTTILFGGKRQGTFRFCSDKCLARGQYLLVADQIPDSVVDEFARRVHLGLCPKCQGPGPVDVHNSYSVWSAVYLTSWKTVPNVVCKECGSKAQTRALLSSLLLGWWGIPWGFLVTPMQIVKNISAMRRDVSPTEPSKELLRVARLHLASRAAAQPPPASS